MVKEYVHYIIVRENGQGDEMAETNSDCDKNGYSRCRSIEELDEMDSCPAPVKDDVKVVNADDKEVVVSVNGKKIPINLTSKVANIDCNGCLDRCESTNSDNFARKNGFNRCESTNSEKFARKGCFNRCESAISTSDNFSRKSSVISTQSTCASTCCKPKVPTVSGPNREKLVTQVAKLAFLKILLVDMGIAVGDFMTDFLQGINLIWDFSTGNFRTTTFYYGIAVLGTSWLPSFYCLFHLWYSDKGKKGTWISYLPFILMFIVFFPIMPSLFYLQLLCQRQVTRKDRKKYRDCENKAHEIKSIAGAIRAPIQIILLFWLMLRGILSMPWNEPLSTTCVEDNLGRIVCFPSIPMASIFFSMLSIIKSMYNLNISPLLNVQGNCLESIKHSFQLFLRFTPFLLSNVIFRVSTFAFLFVYLDFWAGIPCGILFCFNLVYFGVSFTKFGGKVDLDSKQQSNEDLECQPRVNNNCGTQLQRLSTRDYAVPRGIAENTAFIGELSQQLLQVPSHQAVAIYDTPNQENSNIQNPTANKALLYYDTPYQEHASIQNSTPKKSLPFYDTPNQESLSVQYSTPKKSLPFYDTPEKTANPQHNLTPRKKTRSISFDESAPQYNSSEGIQTPKRSVPPPVPPRPGSYRDTTSGQPYTCTPGKVRRSIPFDDASSQDKSSNKRVDIKPTRTAPLPPPPIASGSNDTSFEDNSFDRQSLPPPPNAIGCNDTSFADSSFDAHTLPPTPSEDNSFDAHTLPPTPSGDESSDNLCTSKSSRPAPFPPPPRSIGSNETLCNEKPSRPAPFPPPPRSTGSTDTLVEEHSFDRQTLPSTPGSNDNSFESNNSVPFPPPKRSTSFPAESLSYSIPLPKRSPTCPISNGSAPSKERPSRSAPFPPPLDKCVLSPPSITIGSNNTSLEDKSSAPFLSPKRSPTFPLASVSAPHPIPKRSTTFPSSNGSVQSNVSPRDLFNQVPMRKPRMASISECSTTIITASPLKSYLNEFNSTSNGLPLRSNSVVLGSSPNASPLRSNSIGMRPNPNASPFKNKPLDWLTPNASPVKKTPDGFSSPRASPSKRDSNGWIKNIAIVTPFNETQSTVISAESDYDDEFVDYDAFFDAINSNDNSDLAIPIEQPSIKLDRMLSNASYHSDATIPPYKPSRFARMLSTVSNKSITPSYINEENTSIFFNSVSGMFFPSCYTRLSHCSVANINEQHLLKWQRRIFQTQVVYFNVISLIAIIIVAILVTVIDTFNYAPTTLNPFWFMMGSFFLATMMMVSTALAMEPDSVEMVSNMCPSAKNKHSDATTVTVHKPNQMSTEITAETLVQGTELMSIQEIESDDIDSFLRKRKGNPQENNEDTEDSISISSDRIKKRFLCMHIVYCLIVTFIVLVPAIIGLLVFKYKEDPRPYIYFIDESGSRASVYDMTILTAFPLTSFEFNRTDIIAGSIDNDCFIDTTKSYSDKIILVNQTSPKCSVLTQDEDFLNKVYNSSAKAVILLDNTPRFRWRLSSPYSIRNFFFGSIQKPSNTPILMLRQSDWGKFNNYLDTAENRLFIVFGESNSLDLGDILPCTNSKVVKVENGTETNSVGKPVEKETCSEGKHLYDNGTVNEQVCVESQCWTLGQRCPHSNFDNIRKFEVNLQCDKKTMDGKSLSFILGKTGEVLKPSLMKIANGNKDHYCCKDNGEETSTFVEVLGEGCFEKSRDVLRFMTSRDCQFTEEFRGQCMKGEIEVAKYCRVPGHNCVIKEYYKTYCFNNEPLSHCKMLGTLSCT